MGAPYSGVMHTTTEQNKAHRNDMVWMKTAKKIHADGDNWTSEYTNGFTGYVIRKGWRMTGQDWHIWNAEGQRVGRAHSLTWAKLEADEKAGA